MTEITVKFQLIDQFLSDVLVTAFDADYGGCWYWAMPHKEGADSWVIDSDGTWRSVDVIEQTPTSDRRKSAVVTHDAIGQGIARVLDPSFQVNKQIRGRIATLDAGEIDAEAADVIVQAAMFGEIVYG